MAVLSHPTRGTRTLLTARTLIGRSSAVGIQLQTPGVSGEHAVLGWTPTGWSIRDLGSLNGTWVGTNRIEPGTRVALSAGERLVFGIPEETWILESDAPPDVVAERDGTFVQAEEGLLALPSLERPLVLIEKVGGQWMRVDDDGAEPLVHGSVVVADGEAWTVLLPGQEQGGPLASTKRFDPVMEQSVDRAGLSLAVSSDGEYIEPTVTMGDEEFPITPKAHHELLVVLARQRLSDAESDPESEGEHGWVYTSELRKMLGVSSNQFYVMCHRCRREFKDLGFPDAANIVERRSTSRQVRIGVRQLSVRAL